MGGVNGTKYMNPPQSLIVKLRDNIGRVVLGQSEVVRLTVVALLAGEHVLLEDVPGVGKTLVGKAIARSLASEFHRIQFTPDLLPGDITGSSLYNVESRRVRLQRRADLRQHRAGRRDQSRHAADAKRLLEAMSERQVSVDGQTHPLPRPFMVIATQNPVEFEGTYPLPESQLDRFLLRIPMGYPAREVELQVLTSHRDGEPVDSLAAGARLPQGGRASGGGAAGGGRRGDQRLLAGHRAGDAALRRVARGREHPRRVGVVSGGPGRGAGRRPELRRARRRQSAWPCRCWPIA